MLRFVRKVGNVAAKRSEAILCGCGCALVWVEGSIRLTEVGM